MKEDTQTAFFTPERELRWLFCDLNSYFASVEQQENPALRGKPVAVVPAITDSTCAIAASYEAKAFGIKTGTRIFEAKKMCPDLVCVLARHDVYVAYHHRIFDVVEDHLPVSKICSVDEAACELMGAEKQRGNAIALAGAIKSALRERIGPAITCSIGIAPNAFLAKIASDMHKPDGLTVLEPGRFQERLFELKLTDLPGINTRMDSRLQAGGVTSVEQFWNLAPKHARMIWGGVGGERFWYKLRGYDVPERPTQKSVIGHSRILDPTHRNPDKAFVITSQLTLKAATRLRRSSLYTRRIFLSCKSVGRTRWEDTRALSPTQDNFTLLRTMREMWESMIRDMKGARLQKVGVTFTDLCERQDITLDLFETRQPQLAKGARLSESMDALNKRFGNGTVTIGAPLTTSAGHVGTKIAFNRVPGWDEF